MPSSITICEVPDEVREELAARAALTGRSVEEYVRAELIALAQRPSAAVWMARVRARKDALQAPLPTACITPERSPDSCRLESRSLESHAEAG